MVAVDGAEVVVVVAVVVASVASAAVVSGVSTSEALGEFSKEDIWTASTVVGSGVERSSGVRVEGRARTIEVYLGCISETGEEISLSKAVS